MLSDVLNNECIGRSPCRDCPRHLQGLDKNQCVDKCEWLAAYRRGESWEGKPLPYITKSVTKVKKKGSVMIKDEHRTSNIERPTSNEETKKREYHKTTVQLSPVKQARGLLNKKAGRTCLIDDCDIKDNLIRGLCSKHYQAWRKGYIKHPILGEFTLFQAKSHRKSKVGGAAGIFIEETNGQKPEIDESRMKTPIPVIPAETGIQVKDAEVGKKLKTTNESTLKTMGDAMPKEVIAEIMAARVLNLKAGLIINLDNYLKIKTAVYDTAEKYFVTPEHVVIGLLGEALAARELGYE